MELPRQEQDHSTHLVSAPQTRLDVVSSVRNLYSNVSDDDHVDSVHRSSPTNAKQGQAEDGEVLPASLQSSPTSLPRKRRRSKASSLVYNLRAMVVHHGKQIDEGHYTSICYSDAVHEWVAFNDLKAEIISEANVLQHEGHDYLLFYERVVE